RLLSLFEKRGVSFVSVTQEFNTSTSLGRLTLHILLSFAQFEREMISERTRVTRCRRPGGKGSGWEALRSWAMTSIHKVDVWWSTQQKPNGCERSSQSVPVMRV